MHFLLILLKRLPYAESDYIQGQQEVLWKVNLPQRSGGDRTRVLDGTTCQGNVEALQVAYRLVHDERHMKCSANRAWSL
jgi:hypothetical protein